MNAGGCVEPAGEGAFWFFGKTIGLSGQASSSAIGIEYFSVADCRWTNQSWTMNWIQLAAKQVQKGSGLKLGTRQKPATHVARVRIQHVSLVRVDEVEREVAAEAGSGSAHFRIVEVVVSAIGEALASGLIGHGFIRISFRKRRLFGVVQILITKFVADFNQGRKSQRKRLFVPWPVLAQIVSEFTQY